MLVVFVFIMFGIVYFINNKKSDIIKAEETKNIVQQQLWDEWCLENPLMCKG